MNLNSELIQFMKWYKNNVPIGTQKNSVHIVDDYFKFLQNEQKPSERSNCNMPHVNGGVLECFNCGRKMILEQVYCGKC